MTDDRTREWRDRLHDEAEKRRIYGEVSVRYEAGRPVHAEIRESRKPPAR